MQTRATWHDKDFARLYICQLDTTFNLNMIISTTIERRSGQMRHIRGKMHNMPSICCDLHVVATDQNQKQSQKKHKSVLPVMKVHHNGESRFQPQRAPRGLDSSCLRTETPD